MIDHLSEEIPYESISDKQSIARTVNKVIERFATGSIVLSGTETLLNDDRITVNSLLFLTPKDSTAQTTNYYASMSMGEISITHDSTGAFDYLIIW